MIFQPEQPAETESRDSILVEIHDEPRPPGEAKRPMRDATLRRVFGQRVLSEKPLSAACDFTRLLRLGQEQEKICRIANDQRGVAFCLYNLGLVNAGVGHAAEALRCLEESIRLGQEIGDSAIVAQATRQTEHIRGQ